MCGRELAILGEATHGDGRTLEFKAALVRRLVAECSYDAVFFEASHYDFLDFSRRIRMRETVTEEMLGSSIGRIWNQYEEMAPLIAWLFDEAAAQRLAVGGLDDQLGSAGAYYSIAGMPGELASVLESPRREHCQDALRRRIYSDYGQDRPYREAERVLIRGCLGEIRMGLQRLRSPRELLQMVAAFERYVSRDFVDQTSMIRGRDESMFRNLEWLRAQLPDQSKIIVWTATSHAARDARASQAFPEGGSFGEHVSRTYGRRAFVLGFSAASGSYLLGPGAERAVPPADPESVEARALGDPPADVAYLDTGDLARIGTANGGLFLHAPASADWSRVVDGLVVFREERPPRTRSAATIAASH